MPVCCWCYGHGDGKGCGNCGKPSHGEAQSACNTPPVEQPGKSAASNVDTNSVEGTETDAPIREDWARDRVTRMCASAFVDAQAYRQKLLKGHGYPNETFRAAQDALALQEILERLAAAEARASQAERERDEEMRKVGELLQDVSARTSERDQARAALQMLDTAYCENADALKAAEARADLLQQERDALLPFVQHKRGCPMCPRDDGHKVIRVVTYDFVAGTEAYADPTCTCGLSALRDSRQGQSGSAIATPHGGTDTDAQEREA